MEYNKEKVLEIVNDKKRLVFFEKKARSYKNVTTACLIKLYLRQEERCALCGDELLLDTQKTHIDHIEPRAKGGEDDIDNFELVCGCCNYAKRDMSLSDFVLMCHKVANEYHNTEIFPKEVAMDIVQRRWKKERKNNKVS